MPISSFAAAPARTLGLTALLLLGAVSTATHAQISPTQATQLQNALGARVEALTILGGDFGLSDGNFHSTGSLRRRVGADVDTSVTKLGGDGDVGDPVPLGDLSIGWQPRLQGTFGYLASENSPRAGPQASDRSVYRTYALEFGLGARVWFSVSRERFVATVR